MLSADPLDQLVVVLVRARNPNNIGAVARAMHDFGFRHLRLVSDYPVPYANARSAVDASIVLEEALEYATLAEAVADCTLVVGTTAVGERKLEHALHTLPVAAPLIRAGLMDQRRVALLFGSEKTGLSNEELSYCDWLLTIPMQTGEGRHLSMNLGQAAAVCLFELVREVGPPLRPAIKEPIPAAEVERLTGLLSDVLDAADYRKHHPANSDLAQLRRLVHRLTLDRPDSMVWMGIFRQLLWRLSRRSDRVVSGDADSLRE